MKKRAFDIDAIKTSLEAGNTTPLGKLGAEDLAYLKSWANRRGYAVLKNGDEYSIHPEKPLSAHAEIITSLGQGKVFQHFNTLARQSVRNLLSAYNLSHGTRWKAKYSDGSVMFYLEPEIPLI